MQKIRPDMDIGQNIQCLRRDSKLTQEDVLARLQVMGLQISKSTYAKLETNRMNIKVSELDDYMFLCIVVPFALCYYFYME